MMQCLREDLAGERIGVSVLCPAAVTTNIYQHENMRPAQYQTEAQRSASQGLSEEAERIKGMLTMGMDPVQVGQKVLQGIIANDLYIFTHPMEQPIRERRDALLASLPQEPVNTARLSMDLKIRQMMQESLKGE
jgi:short-subunit dehydrogenase